MSFVQTLLDVIDREWTWFGKDSGRKDHYIGPDGKTTHSAETGGKKNPRKETVEPYSSRVGEYWLAIPTEQYKKLVKDYAKDKGKLDGTVGLAWSAAFISFCFKMAGAHTSFPYASGHVTWIVKAIRNRKQGKLKAALVGYRPGEKELRPGDLIGRPRQKGITYDNAPKKGWFKSHSDIIVEVNKKKRRAYVIGGNVGQSVSRVFVSITADGKLNDKGGWIVHIRNNIKHPKAVKLESTKRAQVG